MGFLFNYRICYLDSTAFGASTLAESTTTLVESTAEVESTATADESVEVVSVDVPFPQDANATIANNATICFMIVFDFSL